MDICKWIPENAWRYNPLCDECDGDDDDDDDNKALLGNSTQKVKSNHGKMNLKSSHCNMDICKYIPEETWKYNPICDECDDDDDDDDCDTDDDTDDDDDRRDRRHRDRDDRDRRDRDRRHRDRRHRGGDRDRCRDRRERRHRRN